MAASATADAPRATAAPKAPNIPHEKYMLANGLEVILAPDSSMPLVTVDVWYHVGSGDEVVGKSGFAHLFEHMLFQGSTHVGADRHFEVLSNAGAGPRSVNGSTNTDRTNYYEIVPSNQLETALWLESDRMAYLLPMLSETSFRNQVDVVRNERRQRYDNQPYGKTLLATYAALYDADHPHKFMTIGRHEDLEGASLADVVGFFKAWYVPSNATLVLAGDFEPAVAKALIEKWFGSFPRSEKPTRHKRAIPKQAAQTVELSDALAKQVDIRYAWHTPARFEPGDAELDILADTLAQAGTGRLYRRLVVESKLATSVVAYQQSMRHSSVFVVNVQLAGGADAKKAMAIIDEEIERVRNEPIAARERARTLATLEMVNATRLQSFLGRAEALQGYNQMLGTPDGFARDLARYQDATVEGIRATAAAYLTDATRLTVITSPGAN
ncbi:MAG: insulinase family protein [Myxococcales bacterium]|nr:insulinase family protein [Myxococcales bacterium]